MQYFTNFPTTLFQVSPPSYRKNPEFVAVSDITRNVRFKKEVIDNISLFDYVNLTDYDSIEVLSEKLYGSPYYHWVLMLLNDKYDYLNDLPLKSETLETKLKTLYPDTTISNNHNATIYNLPVDIVNENGISFDFDQSVESIYISSDSTRYTADNAQIRINTTINGVLVNSVIRPIRSLFAYDSDLKIFVKKIIFADLAGGVYDPSIHSIDFSSLPGTKLRHLYETEVDINEKKRLIKVIDPNVLETVVQNFRDLM